MGKITSEATIEKLRITFATHGLPKVIVTDNGASFTSEEFKVFCHNNGIKLVHSAPYHPRSNGAAENAVKTFKQGMKKDKQGTLQTRVSKFLFHYRLTPHTTTGQSPAQMLMKRKPRSRLSLIMPSTQARVLSKQSEQKAYHDKACKPRDFYCGDPVYAENFGHGANWLPGVIETRTGPVSFVVRLQDGRVVKRHQDHLRLRHPERSGHVEDKVPEMPTVLAGINRESMPTVPEPPNPSIVVEHQGMPTEHQPMTMEKPQQMTSNTPLRRSTRATQGVPPVKLDM